MAAVREFFSVATSNNSAHSCYGSGAAGCSTIANPISGGPVPANQNNDLIRTYTGKDLVK
jgi:filamentous hemagglutinin